MTEKAHTEKRQEQKAPTIDDFMRLPRRERRKWQTLFKVRIPGSNKPFQK